MVFVLYYLRRLCIIYFVCSWILLVFVFLVFSFLCFNYIYMLFSFWCFCCFLLYFVYIDLYGILAVSMIYCNIYDVL